MLFLRTIHQNVHTASVCISDLYFLTLMLVIIYLNVFLLLLFLTDSCRQGKQKREYFTLTLSSVITNHGGKKVRHLP
jgi:hypothetical protein